MAVQIREELEKLLKIQELDASISEARKVLRVAPFYIKPYKEELLKLEAKLAKLIDSKKDTEKKILDLENAVKSDTIYADSMESKLPNVLGNHKEYHFTAKNIDKLRKLGRDRLEEIARLNAKKTEIEIEIEEVLAEKSESQDKLTTHTLALEIQLQEAQEEIDNTLKEKEQFLKVSAPRFLDKYIRVASAYGHGIGIVQDSKCSSCYVRIPPQTFNLLTRGEEILHCPSCQRMLYLKA